MGVKVKMNLDGIKELYKGEEVTGELLRLGSEIAGAANAAGVQAFAEYHRGESPNCLPYQAKVNEHRNMNVCIVRSVGKHGAAIENKHHILKRIAGSKNQ